MSRVTMSDRATIMQHQTFAMAGRLMLEPEGEREEKVLAWERGLRAAVSGDIAPALISMVRERMGLLNGATPAEIQAVINEAEAEAAKAIADWRAAGSP